ncbi:hypothetical protein AB1Y20_011827 [Prymnesium parvum]|uniref:Uncharacterized protein n=1 Tax=Prymnesium parvum TaxID=97485 RepID=A0AB34IIJ0_PRYPA
MPPILEHGAESHGVRADRLPRLRAHVHRQPRLILARLRRLAAHQQVAQVEGVARRRRRRVEPLAQLHERARAALLKRQHLRAVRSDLFDESLAPPAREIAPLAQLAGAVGVLGRHGEALAVGEDVVREERRGRRAGARGVGGEGNPPPPRHRRETASTRLKPPGLRYRYSESYFFGCYSSE